MSGNVTEVLAGFAASLQSEDLPGHVQDHCKKVLLDTLACAVAGHRGEETQQVAALAAALGRLLDDPALRVRLARGARALVEAEFDVHRQAAQLTALFGTRAAVPA